MKLKWNLSLTTKPAQRCALTPAAGPVRKNPAFALLAARANRPIRIPTPRLSPRPALRGDKSYLRALRAAELALWEANLKFPAF